MDNRTIIESMIYITGPAPINLLIKRIYNSYYEILFFHNMLNESRGQRKIASLSLLKSFRVKYILSSKLPLSICYMLLNVISRK